MEYEKKYKDALERAEIAHKDTDKHIKATIERIFPELRESEDERIRKAIIELLKEVEEDETYTGRQHIPDMLAYLEKQKESLHIHETYRENADSFTDEDEKIRIELLKDIPNVFPYEKAFRYIHWLEKQKEQKPGDYCSVRDEFDLEGNLKQKPAEWCEEDDAAHTRILGAVAKAFMGVLPTKPSEEDVHWLKTLPERFNLQPKQEWSEEDKTNLNNIIWLCENCEKGIENVWIPSQARQIKNLIKSLRPQPKQEWSKEDENKIERLTFLVSVVEEKEMISPSEGIDLRNFIRSLRPSWKPSEDEKRLINTSISFLKDFADKGYENAVECIDWLKSKLSCLCVGE